MEATMSGVDWSRLDLWRPPTQQSPALPRSRSQPSPTVRRLVMLTIANLALTAWVLALTISLTLR